MENLTLCIPISIKFLAISIGECMVLFHYVAQKSGRHSKKEDGKAEGPFGSAF